MPDAPVGSIDATYPAVAEAVSRARASVARWLRAQAVEESMIGDVAIAVTEACTNVVVHSYRTEPVGSFHILADRVVAGVRVEVTDHGCGSEPRTDSPGAGLGLPLIAALTKSLDVHADENGKGTVVTMIFDVEPARGTQPSGADATAGSRLPATAAA